MELKNNGLEKTFAVQKLQIEEYKKTGGARLGPWTSNLLNNDPKHLAFSLSRYKFATKLLGRSDEKKTSSVIEVGCGDAFGSIILANELDEYIGIDIEKFVVDDDILRLKQYQNMSFDCWDIIKSPYTKKTESALCLDVIEHIPYEHEHDFINNIKESTTGGPILIGTPNITADEYASKYSKESHINLKSGSSLKNGLIPFYKDIFIFSMNDEVVHTGFLPMSHYIFALACNPYKVNNI